MQEWLKKVRSHHPMKSGADLLQELDALLGGRIPTKQEAFQVAEALLTKFAPDLLERAALLAMAAHRAGLPGAGLLYARALDRAASIRGPWSKYGTTRWDMDGEVTVAPLDGSVTEAERAELGLPPFEQVIREAREENLRRAQRQADEPLPPGALFRRVWQEITPAAVLERRARENAPAWLDGDVLTLVYQGQANDVRLAGGVQLQPWHLPDSDLWVTMVKLANPEEAMVGYLFMPVTPGRPVRPEDMVSGVWRGSKAPTPPRRASTVTGSIRHHRFPSQATSETRDLTLYLPPGHDPARTSPVIYCTDGGSVEAYALVLEPLITGGQIPPALLVGVHPAWADGLDLRGQEYLPGLNPARFSAHLELFTEEVPAWAQAELGASPRPEERAIFGVSNGAAFAIEAGRRLTGRYGTILAFSVAGGVGRNLPPDAHLPPCYLVAGTMERGFLEETRAVARHLSERGVDHLLRERIAGHDHFMWEEEFPSAVAWALSRRQSAG